MQFKTKSGLPFNSTEQREYFEKLQPELKSTDINIEKEEKGDHSFGYVYSIS